MLSRGKDAGLLMLTALLSVLMLGMGGWQLSRAEEKRQLLSEWQQRRDSGISLTQASAMSDPFGYRLTTQGRYLAGSEVFLDNQVQAGRVGYRLVRALPSAQGLLMVDTGWWPADADRRVLPVITTVMKPIPLAGHLIRPYQPPISLGKFTFIPSHPLVPSLTPSLLAQIWGEPVLPFVLKLDNEDEDWQPVVMRPERHVGYAMQWFLMAFAVCIAVFWYHRRPMTVNPQSQPTLNSNDGSNHRSQHHSQHHSRYCTLLALWLVFLLPVGLAWLTLQQGWFTAGANNHGQWITGQVAADSQWRLIVPLETNCESCSQAESLLEPVILALGRDGRRVRLMLTPATAELKVGFVYIADPPGTLIMRYPLQEFLPQEQLRQPQQEPLMSKALLQDLRRLLTHSRAG